MQPNFRLTFLMFSWHYVRNVVQDKKVLFYFYMFCIFILNTVSKSLIQLEVFGHTVFFFGLTNSKQTKTDTWLTLKDFVFDNTCLSI